MLPTILSRCRTLHFKPIENSKNHAEDPLSKALLTLLMNGKFDSYSELASQAKSLAEIIESRSKLSEEALRKELTQYYSEKLTAQQRESIDKEIEGALALQTAKESRVIFDGILAWYRDLLLLSVGGDKRFLFYPEALDSLQKAQKIDLPRVFAAVESAKTALARSTSLHLCLESLFLKLDFI
jgi:DNA polymerase-3 subunit delta'